MAANQSPSSRGTPRLNCCALGCHGDPSAASTCAPLPGLPLRILSCVFLFACATAASSTTKARIPISVMGSSCHHPCAPGRHERSVTYGGVDRVARQPIAKQTVRSTTPIIFWQACPARSRPLSDARNRDARQGLRPRALAPYQSYSKYRFQTKIAPSSPTVTSCLSSGLNTRSLIAPEWPTTSATRVNPSPLSKSFSIFFEPPVATT